MFFMFITYETTIVYTGDKPPYNQWLQRTVRIFGIPVYRSRVEMR